VDRTPLVTGPITAYLCMNKAGLGIDELLGRCIHTPPQSAPVAPTRSPHAFYPFPRTRTPLIHTIPRAYDDDYLSLYPDPQTP